MLVLLCAPDRLAANSFFEVLRPRFCSGKAFACFPTRSRGSRRFDSPRFLSGRAGVNFFNYGPHRGRRNLNSVTAWQCPAPLKKQNICGRNFKFTQMQMLWLESSFFGVINSLYFLVMLKTNHSSKIVFYRSSHMAVAACSSAEV